MQISAFDDITEKIAVALVASQQKMKWANAYIQTLETQNQALSAQIEQLQNRINNLEKEAKLLNELYVIRIGDEHH